MSGDQHPGWTRQYRVTWRRSTWTKPQHRTYASRAAADRYIIDRLLGGDIGLDPIDDLQIEVRWVASRWTPLVVHRQAGA